MLSTWPLYIYIYTYTFKLFPQGFTPSLQMYTVSTY